MINKTIVYFSCVLSIAFIIPAQGMQTPPPPLPNCGVSCYMNATIQAFYNIRPLTDILIKSAQNMYKKGSIAQLYTQLITQLNAKKNAEAGKIIGTLAEVTGKKLAEMQGVTQIRQEDASEFFPLLLDQLINEGFEGREKTAQEINDLFYFKEQRERADGTIRPTTRSTFIAVPIQTPEPDEKQLHSLQESFQEYIKWEPMGRLIFGNEPKILTVQLKRFINKIDPQGNVVLSKLPHPVTIPQQFDFSPYLLPKPQNPVLYDLISTIVHRGNTLGSGHYVAYVNKGGQWYLCNDTTITPQTFTQAKPEIDQSYIVIYQKIPAVAKPPIPPQPNPVAEPLNNLAKSLQQLGSALEKK
jgi:ubiquitin C-terminal hydrolase